MYFCTSISSIILFFFLLMKLTFIFVVFLYGFPNVIKFLVCLNITFFCSIVNSIKLISTTLGILNCLLSLLSPFIQQFFHIFVDPFNSFLPLLLSLETNPSLVFFHSFQILHLKLNFLCHFDTSLYEIIRKKEIEQRLLHV